MATSQNPLEHIAQLLETKSAVKQDAFNNLCKNFKLLESEAKKVVKLINNSVKNRSEDITISVKKISNHEFHLKFAGDLLVFFMHTNIVVLDKAHGYNTSEYVQANDNRKYLGQINVYNFMADSFKYNRLNDPGYLIARIFVNAENHFLVEGERQLNFMYEHVSTKPVSEADLSIIVQLTVDQCIDNDLITSPFPSIRNITLHQKLEKSQALGGGHKIGFQMSYQQKLE